MILLDARPNALAVVTVRHAVTTAYRQPDRRTDLATRHTSTLEICRVALPLWQIAELALLARNTSEATAAALLATDAVVVLLNAGAEALAVVAVGHAVAATNGIEDRQAHLRPRQANTLQIGGLTLARRQLAHFSKVTPYTRDTTADLVAAFAVVVFLNAGADTFAIVAVGLTVTTAHRIVNTRTTQRNGDALTANVYPIAETRQVIAELAFVALEARETIADGRLPTLAVVVFLDARADALAIVAVGSAVTAAHRVKDRRAHG